MNQQSQQSGVYLLAPHQLPLEVDAISLAQHGCVTKDTILSSLTKAFAFPAYFGNNWDAAYDCLLERFDQLKHGRDVYFTLTAATEVDESALNTFKSLLEDVCDQQEQDRPLHFFIVT